ncbi:MAG: SsrA-binding protein [Chlamydiia bacterium]|nr:SsrA-binding protein [Chlamydiia bacterium]
MKKKKTVLKDLVSNKVAYHNYEVVETLEAGVKLVGTEVKSLKEGGASLQDNYITIKNGEAFLMQAYIGHYKFGNVHNHEERRERKLLMHKSEIEKFRKQKDEKGLTIVALSMYLTKTGFVKVKIGLCRGKKLFDKRSSLKEKSQNREIQRALKNS